MKRIFTLAGMSCFALPGAQAEHAARLPSITVEDQYLSGSALIPTADEVQDEFKRAAGAQSVLKGEAFRNGKVSSQEDLFKHVPGVFVSSQNGGDDVHLSIRGSGLGPLPLGRGINSYLDGLPLSRLESGTTNQLLDLLAYDYVEVYRGGNALELGSTAIGGAINYIPHTGYSADGFRARTEVGSFDYYRTQLSTGDVIGPIDYYFSLNSLHLDGFRDHETQENYRLTSNFGYKVNDWIENRTYLSASRARTELAGTIPKSELKDSPKDAGFFNELVDADRNWKDVRLANKTSLLFEQSELELGLFANYSELDHLPTPFVGIIDNRYRQVGLTSHYRSDADLWGHENRYILGARIGVASDSLERFRYTDGGRQKGLQHFDGRGHTDQLETYFEDSFSLTDRLRLIGGGQYVYATREFDDRALSASPPAFPPFPPQPSTATGDQSFDETYHGLNPKLGLNFDLSRGGYEHFVFANGTRSIEIPTSSDIADAVNRGRPVLDEQKAWTIETGSRGSTARYYWDLTFYRAWIRDEILAEAPFPGAAFTVKSNADSTIHQGIELGLGGTPFETLFAQGDEIFASIVYNLQDFYFDDDELFGNTALPHAPDHYFYLNLEYRHPDGYFIGPNLRFVDDYQLTIDGTGSRNYEVDDYYLLGFRLGRNLRHGISWFLDFRNLTDKKYAADGSVVVSAQPGGQANVTPGDGRAVYFGLEFKTRDL